MFRPCIDLHQGQVKQIIGGSLTEDHAPVRTNFVSDHSPAWFARLYRQDALAGGHVIMLGPGNEGSAREALEAYPGGLQVGGGITENNAKAWLDAGASHVIVTSRLFRDGQLDPDRLTALVRCIGKEHLVLDLSCRKRDGQYWIVTDRWQKFTRSKIDSNVLNRLSHSCAEFLVHAVDVEGLCQGIDLDLVKDLATWSPIPTTYAGGAQSIGDLRTVTEVSRGRIDLTIGSALDIFGGTQVRYQEAVAFNREQHVRAADRAPIRDGDGSPPTPR